MKRISQTLIADQAVIENKKIISPAVISVRDGVIEKISEVIPPNATNVKILDAMFLLPGFVNAHCHLELTALGTLETTDFIGWIAELMQKKQSLTPAAMAVGITTGIERLARSGVTTIIDHVSSETPLSFYEKSPVRIIPFGEVLGVSCERSEISYKNLVAQQQQFKNLQITPHAFHTVHPQTLAKVFAEKHPPFSIHLLESEEEQELFHHRSGKMSELIKRLAAEIPELDYSPFKMAEVAHWNLNQSLIVHANFINEADIALMKKWPNLTVVHCPGSFEFFQHNTSPVAQLKKHNIPLALGTDSLASNRSLNFLDEIRLFCEKNPTIDFFELLPLVTTNACQAIGLQSVGEIREGYFAELIGIKINPQKNVLGSLLEKNQIDFSTYQ